MTRRFKLLLKRVRAPDIITHAANTFIMPLLTEKVRPLLSKDVRTLGIGLTVIGVAGLLTTYSVGETGGSLLTACCGVIIWLAGLWLSSLK